MKYLFSRLLEEVIFLCFNTNIIQTKNLGLVMERKILSGVFIAIIVCLLFGFPTCFFGFNFSKDIKHDTAHWAIIEERWGTRLAIEPTNELVWEELLNPNYNLASISIWGTIISYDNSWQFRFDPATIRVEYGWKSSPTLNDVSSNLEHYLGRDVGIIFHKVSIFEHKFYGLTLLIIDLSLALAAIVAFSLFLFLTKKRKEEHNTKQTPID